MGTSSPSADPSRPAPTVTEAKGASAPARSGTAGTRGAGRRRAPGGPPVAAFSPHDARSVRGRDLWVRFAFGAGISTAASVISLVMGLRVGGLLLAFPAILPATLTLLEAEESELDALRDDVGAVLGAMALAAFAALAWWLLRIAGPAVALPAAALGWLACALALYAGLRAVTGHDA